MKYIYNKNTHKLLWMSMFVHAQTSSVLWQSHFTTRSIIIIMIECLIKLQEQRQHPHKCPLPGSWLAAHMADHTPDPQVCLSWGSITESFHSLPSLSVSCFHVILGLPVPRFPSNCMSQAVLTAPLARSTCPYHRSFLSFRMRSRSSIPSRECSSMDLMVTMSCGLTL